MNLIDTDADLMSGTGLRATFGDEEGFILEVVVTDEGVVMDAYTDGGTFHIGTKAMTAEEWFEFISV